MIAKHPSTSCILVEDPRSPKSMETTQVTVR